MTQYYDNDIFNETNQIIYGKWKFLSSSGSIAGGTYPATYDYLEILRYGIYGIVKDNRIKEVGRIVILHQDSSETTITFFPDKIYMTDLYNPPKTVQYIGTDTLILNDPCCDLFSYLYIRVK